MFVGCIEGYVENKVTMLCWMIVFAKKKGLMLFVLIKVFTPLINQLNTEKWRCWYFLVSFLIG